MTVTAVKDRFFGRLNTLADRWERFWFTPTSATTLGLVRILYGIVLFGWTASMTPDLLSFFSDSDRGMVPAELARPEGWNVLLWVSADWWVWACWAVLLVASVAVIVGLRPTIALLVAFVLTLSFERRNIYLLNSGDFVVKDLALLLALCPSGAALSLDRWRKVGRERFWDRPPVTQWGLRLIQIQTSLIYFFSFWNKTGGGWRGGSASSTALRIEDLQRFRLPAALVESLWFSTVLTWGTLAVELAMAILVWNRKWRKWALLGAVTLHVGIDLTLLVGWFSYAMFCALLAFVPSETTDRWVDRARSWWPARRGRSAPEAEPGPGERQPEGAPPVPAAVRTASGPPPLT